MVKRGENSWIKIKIKFTILSLINPVYNFPKKNSIYVCDWHKWDPHHIMHYNGGQRKRKRAIYEHNYNIYLKTILWIIIIIIVWWSEKYEENFLMPFPHNWNINNLNHKKNSKVE